MGEEGRRGSHLFLRSLRPTGAFPFPRTYRTCGPGGGEGGVEIAGKPGQFGRADGTGPAPCLARKILLHEGGHVRPDGDAAAVARSAMKLVETVRVIAEPVL